jgi:plastocyanin
MKKPQINSKTVASYLIISILLVGIGISYSSLYIHSISAKKGSSGKTTSSTSTTASSVSSNNNTSIAMNALELKNETYRWQNTSKQINPTLHLIANTDYTFKIKNPTDTKHELIIGSNGTELTTSKDINPGKSKSFVFSANSTGIFEYHCEYHPDTMKGIIEITGQ